MKKTVLIFAAGLLLFFSGCASYDPNVNMPTSIKKIAVPVFINKTKEYGIEQYATQQTIDEFLSEGKVSITENERKADGIVQCRITDYIKSVIRVDDNTQVAQEYRLRVYVDIYFFDNIEQVLLWKEEGVYEETTYYVANDLGMEVEDETTAANRVLDVLAKRAVRRVLYGW